MADLIPPSPLIQGSSPIAQSNTLPSSNSVASIPTGTVLQGFIINRDASGNPIVRTPQGDIAFTTNFFLKIGSEVVLRFGNAGGNSQAQLLSVNGQSPEDAQNASAFSQEPEVILGPHIAQTVPSSSAATPQGGITVNGTVVAQPQTGNTQGQAVLSNGTQVTVKIVSVNIPAAQATPAVATNVQGSANPLANTITATVVGAGPSGETLVQSPLGLVRLQPGFTIPTGSQINLQILQATPPSAQDVLAALAANTQPAPIIELAKQWTSIQQVVSLLSGQATTPGLASGATSAPTLPTNIPNLAAISANTINAQGISSALLVFISALRKGDFDNWLGTNNIKLLQNQGHDDLLKKAGAEFSGLARQFTQSQPGHWQPLFFPLAVDGAIQQIRLFTKRDGKQGSDKNNKKQDDTRFVIEVDLSQLGELQMDGFVRKESDTLQFDMVIRSLSGLSNEVQSDIAKIYNNMGEITGYKGSITFQNVKEFPVNPMQDITNTHDNVVA